MSPIGDSGRIIGMPRMTRIALNLVGSYIYSPLFGQITDTANARCQGCYRRHRDGRFTLRFLFAMPVVSVGALGSLNEGLFGRFFFV